MQFYLANIYNTDELYVHVVKCEVTLVTYEVEYTYIIGGFDINFQLSDLCQISDSDNVTCTINEERIKANSSDNKIFSCQVPSLEKAGEHVFQIEGQTASNGGFTYQNSIIIRKLTTANLYFYIVISIRGFTMYYIFATNLIIFLYHRGLYQKY